MNRQNAFDFFFEHSGIGYFPAKESEFAGRTRNAVEMARVEYVAWDLGYTYEWSIDLHAVWDCTMRDTEGNAVQSLGSVDFGAGGGPFDPYARVVQAELALEQLS